MDYKQYGKLTIKDTIDRYIDNKSINGLLSATTIENRKIELFRFERFCKQNKITEPDNLHKNHLVEYLKRLKTSNGTKQTLINIYRSFFDFLVDEELILDNIAATIKPPKTNRPAPDYLTYEELERIYQSEAINASSKVVDRNLLILSMLVEMGLRVSEMIGIKLSDLDLEAKQVWVTKKGGVTKKTPFNDSIKNQIETWLSFRPHFKNSGKEDRLFLATTGKGLNRKQVYEIISNAIDRAGLVKKKKGPHLLRHTGATLRSMRGDDIETIRVWLDHKSYAMSQVYNHAGKALLQKTVENELLKDKEKYRSKNEAIISKAIMMSHKDRSEGSSAIELESGSKLFMEICDRSVTNKIPVKDMKNELVRALCLMLQEDYSVDALKKLLNQYGLSSLSGKPRWTVKEIRKLTRGYKAYQNPL